MIKKTFKDKFPQLVEYWDDNINNVTIDSIIKINDKFHFKCKKGHRFHRTCRDITDFNKFCTVCYTGGRENRFIVDEYTKDKLTFFKQENNPDYILSYLGIGSRVNITWTCPEGHNFKKNVGDFSKPTGTSCPKCRELGNKQKYNNQRFGVDTLGALSNCHFLNNEFSKNNKILSNTISLGNNRTKVLWTCPLCEKDYKSSANQRYRKKTGCPTCNNKRTQSKNEIRIFCELKKLFKSVKENYLIDGYKYDVYIKDINLLIEYDGYHWHSKTDSIKNDIKKNKITEKHNINLVRLREKGLSKTKENDIIINMNLNTKRNENAQSYILKLLLNYIKEDFNVNFPDYEKKYLSKNKFINEKLYTEKLSNGFVENNLTKHPKIAEYDQDKTGINPKAIYCSSSSLIWWKCKEGDDHSWQDHPLNRKRNNCPFCSNRRVSTTNRLDIIHPESLNIWSHKNNNKPTQYTYRSGQKVWWNCNYCEKEFKSSIAQMNNSNGYCPCCKNKNFSSLHKK